jgi:hypothetical protein
MGKALFDEKVSWPRHTAGGQPIPERASSATDLWQLDDYAVAGDAFGVVWLSHKGT